MCWLILWQALRPMRIRAAHLTALHDPFGPLAFQHIGHIHAARAWRTLRTKRNIRPCLIFLERNRRNTHVQQPRVNACGGFALLQIVQNSLPHCFRSLNVLRARGKQHEGGKKAKFLHVLIIAG